MRQLNVELDENGAELKGILYNKLSVFMDIYAPYLEGFSAAECDEVRKSIITEIFSVDITQGNSIVKKASDEYRKNQIKTQMYKLWSDKADGTKNPKVWSDRYRIPILCCISSKEYVEAKKAFSVLNSNAHSDSDIKTTIEFLENATFFGEIANQEYRDECFIKVILGEYANVLQNMNAVKDAIEVLGYEVYYQNRKKLLKSFPESELAYFVSENQIDLEGEIYNYTDTTVLEKRQIVNWISNHGWSDLIPELYPQLGMYMKKYIFNCGSISDQLTEYFELYKLQKIQNRIEDRFLDLVDEYGKKYLYTKLPTRDSAINKIDDKQATYLYWVDFYWFCM